jgi:hypothetical protein
MQTEDEHGQPDPVVKQSVSRETGSRNRRSAPLNQPLRSCLAITTRRIWLVPS